MVATERKSRINAGKMKVWGVNSISCFTHKDKKGKPLSVQKTLPFGMAKEYDYLYLLDSTKDNASSRTDVVLLKNPEKAGCTSIKIRKGGNAYNITVSRLRLEGKVLISEDENAFYLRKATKAQIEKFAHVFDRSANVGRNGGFQYSCLTEEQKGLIGKFDDIKEITIVCSEQEGAYVILNKLSPDQQKKILPEQIGIRQANSDLKRFGVFKGYVKGSLHMPRYYTEFLGIVRHDNLEIENLDNGIMILGKPGRCSVCGGEIRRDKSMHFVHMCKSCENAVPIAYEAMQADGGRTSGDELNSFIRELQATLAQLEETEKTI